MNKIREYFDIKKLIKFSIILLLFLSIDYILVIGYYFFFNKHDDIFASIIIVYIKYFIIIGIFIIHHREYLKNKWFDFKKNIKKYFEISFKNWFLGFLIMITSNIIINYFFKGLGQNEENVQLLIKNFPLLAFIMTTVFAPFVEEMIFRKYLQDANKNKTIFMILSGLLFGLIHVIGTNNLAELLLIVPYGSLGFMFAKTLNETDNIYSTVLMHMLHNGVLTILSIWVM